jgi:hypothetical protein
VRAAIDPDALRVMIPRVVAEVDPNAPIAVIETMRDRVNFNVYVDRLLSMLSAAFAALAALLAGIGLYGVLAYNVAQRTRELGLRLALGAEPRRLQRLVPKQVGTMAMIGAAVGLVRRRSRSVASPRPCCSGCRGTIRSCSPRLPQCSRWSWWPRAGCRRGERRASRRSRRCATSNERREPSCYA